MVNAKDSKTGSARFATPLKVAVWFAVLGFIMLAVETPYWVMPTDTQHAAAATSTPASAPQDTDYFPARYPAPTGEPEPAPPTF
jgi:hypothetical protein